eukprot:scaffold220950_cov17-Tisochrysis_lutea.AAC.2
MTQPQQHLKTPLPGPSSIKAASAAQSQTIVITGRGSLEQRLRNPFNQRKKGYRDSNGDQED